MTSQAYTKSISVNEWGGQIELHLLARKLNAPIQVNEHYDTLVRPGQKKHNQVELISTVQQGKEIKTSQEIINDDWKGINLETKDRTQKKRS